MPPETLPPDETSTAPQEISRRKLLKMLTVAGAGASTVVLLSGQWVKPVAAGGKLAPHAQTSQPVTHVIVSGSAQQDQQTFDLVASALISPADPNIPIVATVSDVAAAQRPQVVYGSLTANTDNTGHANFTFTSADLSITCTNPPTQLAVAFAFANAADGTGTLTVNTPWAQPC